MAGWPLFLAVCDAVFDGKAAHNTLVQSLANGCLAAPAGGHKGALQPPCAAQVAHVAHLYFNRAALRPPDSG